MSETSPLSPVAAATFELARTARALREAAAHTPRAMCYTCFKPVPRCVCHSVRRALNRTGITLILHPRERHHPLGTLRLAELGLSGVHTLVDTLGCVRQGPKPSHLPEKTGLLYPSPSARELSTLPAGERPEHLVVLDGTWTQVKTVFRDTPWLHQLPHYRLTPSVPSRYRIRREPKADYVSTIESLVLALQLLEPDTPGIRELLEAFERMIDQQIEGIGAERLGHFRLRRRPPQQRLLPRALFAPVDQLVVVYSERHASHASPSEGERHSFVNVAARRLASGETLQCTTGPSPAADWLSPEEFDRRWSELTRPDDVFVTWGPACLERLPLRAPPPTSQHVILKAAYGRLGRGRGSLDAIVQHEALARLPHDVPGRIGTRLGQAAALTLWLRDHYATPASQSPEQPQNPKQF